jgi:GDP-L-fucose synthase
VADACLFLMEHYGGEGLINIGVGEDVSIRDLAETVREVVGFTGPVVYDGTKPDGTSQKLLDVTRLSTLGWRARTPLREGIAATYRWFVDQSGAGNRPDR